MTRRLLAIAALAASACGRGDKLSATHTTGVGERRVVQLSDGTHATLGPMSTLGISAGFGGSDRRVDLNGEAHFEVAADSSRAFRVRAFGVITEVTGTTIDVRALGADSVVHVIVAEGSASVYLEGQRVTEGAILKTSDVVELDARTHKAHIVRNAPVAPLLSWLRGPVTFENVEVARIAVEMQRWYGVTMRFQPPDLVRRTVTYELATNDLAAAIKAFSTALGVQVEHKGDTLFVQ